MAEQNFRKERIKNALDNRKLNLSAPTPGHQGKRASLIWGLYSNNPRITVYTGDPNDQDASKNYGKIQAAMDAPTFYMLLDTILKACDFKPSEEKPEFKRIIENKNFIFPGGKRSEEPVVVSRTVIGKDKDGVVYISVVDRKEDRPRIRFNFGENDFHRFLDEQGKPIGNSATSIMHARAQVTLLTSLLGSMLDSHWQEPEPKQQGGQRNGGGGGGGWNGQRNGGGGGGGSQRSSQDESFGGDDIPF